MFANVSPQHLHICIGTDSMNIDSFLTASDGDGFGDYFPGILTWSVYTPPSHGSISGLPDTMSYPGYFMVPSGVMYYPDAGFTGLDYMTIQLVDTFGDIDTTQILLYVITPPTPIAAPPIICLGTTDTLTDSSAFGNWLSSDSSVVIDISSGAAQGYLLGTAVITYTNGCGANQTVTIAVDSGGGTITGSSAGCLGSTFTLSDSLAHGSWSSDASGIATISDSGVITGAGLGTAHITYSTGCGTNAVMQVTIETVPVTGPVSGLTGICIGVSDTYTDTSAGGFWTSSSGTVATIDSFSGILTGHAAGSTIVSYTISNVCGAAHSIKIVTVNPSPYVSVISGTGSVCPGGSTITLGDSTTGGLWTSLDTAIATISTGGVVTGHSSGVDSIKYTVTNSCGTTTTSRVITVDPAPSAGYIYGVGGVCSSGTMNFHDDVSGGTWTSSNTSLATISSGTVSGVAAGTDTISYSVTTTCGSATSTHRLIVGSSPVISTIGGNTTAGFAGDGTGAISGEFHWPYSIAIDNSGNLYIGDEYNNRVRKISNTGIVTTIAGTGTAGFSGDGGPATLAEINGPAGIAVDPSGNVYIADASNNRIRKITIYGIINTVAGDGTAGYSSDGVSATSSELNNPTGIAVDGSGTMFIADNLNARIRKVSPSGLISTICGTGTPGYTGDGGYGTAAEINAPIGIAIDGSDNIFFTDAGSNTVRELYTTGHVETLAGTGTAGFSGDGGIATSAELNGPYGVFTDASGSVYFVDQTNNRVRKISAGYIKTVAGNGTSGFSGDFGAATAAELNTPAGVAVDAAGNVFIADAANNVIRAVSNVCSCSGTPSSGIISASDTNGCGTYSSVLSLVGATTVPGISYQWQSSSLGVTYTDIPGATGTTYIATVTANEYVQCVVTCSASGLSATTPPVLLLDGLPFIGAISGLDTVCSGSTITLSDTTLSGIWSVSDSDVTISSGVVTGVTGGSVVVSYSKSNFCGTASATMNITVIQYPDPAPITGPFELCTTSAYTLTDSVAGGIWTSASTGVVSISSGGIVTVVDTGSALISYTISNMCGTAAATRTVSVFPTLTVSSISGTGVLCAGSSATLTDSVAGGSWVSDNTGVATISASGVLHGVAADTTTIVYTFTNPCGTSTTSKLVTINPLPVAGTISGTPTACPGSTSSLTDYSTGGTWSSTSSSVASVSATGVVTANATGTAIISYSVTNSCGTAGTGVIFTVLSYPDSGTISGSAICAGDSTLLTETSSGGLWSSSDPGVATINDSTGQVLAISGGTTTIHYTIAAACETVIASKTFTVYPTPNAGTIYGPLNICSGSTATFGDSTSTGTWSSSNVSVLPISAIGTVTATATTGSGIISYTVSNSCGTSLATLPVTVHALPVAGTISGTTTICAGTNTTLSDLVPGGTWSASSTFVALVSSGGVVHGLSAGLDTISYTVTNSCGTAVAVSIVSVSPLPFADTITGNNRVCANVLFDTLHNSSMLGSWSSTNTSVAIISTSGVLSPVSTGTTIISYTVTNSCGTNATVDTVTVLPLPVAGIIAGDTAVCVGGRTTLVDTTGSGTWGTSSSLLATVSSGIVTGVSGGHVAINYLVTNTCGSANTSVTLNVIPTPDPGSITGTFRICSGLTDTLHDVIDGIWTCADTLIASIYPGGTIVGHDTGITTITVTVSNFCGSAVTTHPVTVYPEPSAGIITGAGSLCQSAMITLTDSAPGGFWNSSDTAVVRMAGDIVNGAGPGTAIVTYLVTNFCGNAVATKSITVLPSPSAAAIGGPTEICFGSVGTLTDSTSGGTWRSDSAAIASVTSAGVVSGLAIGSAVISYSVSEICGTAVRTITVGIAPPSYTDTISGPTIFCSGVPTTFTDSTAGGAWRSSDTTVATVVPSGSFAGSLVTGGAGGVATISYTVHNYCGTATATKTITIKPLPDTGVISGPGLVCTGSVITLSETTTGGTWSASNSDATISSSGIVTGVSAGIDTIKYSKTNDCGTFSSRYAVIVGPYAGVISGASSVCKGSSISLTEDVPGGTWTVGNANASVTGSGIVAGLIVGFDSVRYTVVNSCGTISTSREIVIDTFPNSGTILGTDSLCQAASFMFTNADTGGVWIATNSNAIFTANVLSGVTPGPDSVLYIITNACGADTSLQRVFIKSLALAGVISGPTMVCVNSAITLTDFVPGGIWSQSNAMDTLSMGVLTGGIAGTDTIGYSVTNSCSTDKVLLVVTVNPLPYAGIITGANTICAGDSVVLTDTTSGGMWGCDTTMGQITAGTFKGLVAGLDTVSYSVTNICGTAVAKMPVLIKSLAYAAPIQIPGIICQNAITTLTDSVTGGLWHAADSNAIIDDTSGLLLGLKPGRDTIYYTVTNSCGFATARTIVTINPAPYAGVITGIDSVCKGDTTRLTDPVSGGIWSISNNNASISNGHINTIFSGLDTVLYVVNNICGFDTSRSYLVIESTATASVTGKTYVCIGSLDTLTGSPSGGLWTTSNGNASVDVHGIISGLQPGLDTLTYTYTNKCNSASRNVVMTVYSALTCPDGVHDISQAHTEGIGIYPNPTTGSVHITAPDFGAKCRIMVLDMYGRSVMEVDAVLNTSNAVDLDMSNLSKGAYLIKMTDGVITANQKLVVW